VKRPLKPREAQARQHVCQRRLLVALTSAGGTPRRPHEPPARRRPPGRRRHEGSPERPAHLKASPGNRKPDPATSQADWLLAALIDHDGGAVPVECVLEECEAEGAQSSEPPWVITVSTTAPDEHRSHRSAAIRGRAGVLSSEAFIPSTPPLPAGNLLAPRRPWVASAYLLTWSLAWHQASRMTGRDVDQVVPA
jgi:hypothetical protein